MSFGVVRRVLLSVSEPVPFDTCIGLDGRAEVRLGTDTATCKAGTPDVCGP
jgi:hypothetical protein